MARKSRLFCLTVIVLLALPAATVRAAVRMPVGFFDDPSFRWSKQAAFNMQYAEGAHANVIHALVNWAVAAPKKPKNPLSGSDYHLTDVDALVRTAQKYDLQVLLTISGTPSWANGGQGPNHPPTDLNNLTQFAHMLANRYNGRHPGFGVVTMFSVWNEPNLGQFLTPQFAGKKIVSPTIYAHLFMAAYKGIKAGDPQAVVAAGETSNRGRNVPTGKPGQDSVAPATFAQLVAQADPHLPLVAWATHPYPTNFRLGPAQKVAWPNVAFSTMTKFGQSLQKWYGHTVPIWVTEYAEMTKPQSILGVSYAQQAADAKKALHLAAENPYVQMFVWFVFRDSNAQTWFSGIMDSSGKKKPAYAAFASTASGIVGQTLVVKPNHTFRVTVAVPFLAWHGNGPVGLTYAVRSVKGSSDVIAAGQAREPIMANETVTFPVAFDPVKGVPYTLTVTFNNAGGQKETHVIALLPSGNGQV